MRPSRAYRAAIAASFLLVAAPVAAQDAASRPLPGGARSGLPLVASNDNRTPAGATRGGVREIALEVVRADWRVEAPDGPGLRVAAIAEVGRAPVVPAPLIRVETGTRLRVGVRNRLDTYVMLHGLHAHPTTDPRPVRLAAGADTTIEFEAGRPGTYLYSAWEGEPPPKDGPRLELMQTAGALVVDPLGGSPPDRILVVNIYSQRDSAAGKRLEALAINGRSWPHTERFTFGVGDRVRWRVVNASNRNHPMHLHGFYYDVLARGTVAADTLYVPEARRLVVTESMAPQTTMLMEWTASRPGFWLFHCHLSFHVRPELRLPGAAGPHEHQHMAGLVLGIEVAPGPTDLVWKGETERLDLYANEYGKEKGHRFGFAREPDFVADSLTDAPGPMLVFTQHRPVEITVKNRMSVPTSVHWHGLELDSWADGVPDWSASDGRMSPAIAPGDSFTYRLALLRPGTFIYHSHLDDVHQLMGGLYGPLIVLPEGETFDPRTDHVMVLGWNAEAESLDDVDLNGRRIQPPGSARVGERHRFRVINIAPAGMISAWLTRDGKPVPVTLHAKDGADLPDHQRVAVERLPRMGVGETRDFLWVPREAGVYELRIGYDQEASIAQRWVVRGAATGGTR